LALRRRLENLKQSGDVVPGTEVRVHVGIFTQCDRSNNVYNR
jgi:hypothetical protein